MATVISAEGRPRQVEVRRGRLRPTLKAMRRGTPRFVAFNGRAQRYARHPIEVPVGEPVRIYLVNAGPTFDSAFHVIGNIFDVVQPDGNPDSEIHGVQTQGVPAGGAASFELAFPEAGVYPFLTHAIRYADAGAIGHFAAR